MSSKYSYEFYKENGSSKMFNVEMICIDENGEIEPIFGPNLISFDGEKIYNLWTNYPWDFTDEEIEIFKKEDPYWHNFFKDRKKDEKPKNVEAGYPITIKWFKRNLIVLSTYKSAFYFGKRSNKC